MFYYGDIFEGMVELCMEFLCICVVEYFNDVVIFIKVFNIVVMVRMVCLLVKEMEKEGMVFLFYLGVIEVGDGEDGRIKFVLGIGVFFVDGLGDIICVLLSEVFENEILVVCKLVDYILIWEGYFFIFGKEVL